LIKIGLEMMEKIKYREMMLERVMKGNTGGFTLPD